MTKTILILNGPNLNLLGKRQPEIYGSETLNDVARLCADKAGAFDCGVEMRQSWRTDSPTPSRGFSTMLAVPWTTQMATQAAARCSSVPTPAEE